MKKLLAALTVTVFALLAACSSPPATPAKQACQIATKVYDSPQEQYQALAKASKLAPPASNLQFAINRVMYDIKNNESWVSDQANVDYYC